MIRQLSKKICIGGMTFNNNRGMKVMTWRNLLEHPKQEETDFNA